MSGCMKHKLESRFPGEISITSDYQYLLRYSDDITLMAEREDELKNLLIKVKKESEKPG